MATTIGIWPALERGELGSATHAEWRHRLGDAFSAAKRFLLRIGPKAEAIPEFRPHGILRYWTVVEHAPGDLVGIDEEFGERRVVKDAERAVFAFDCTAFVAAIREGCGLQRLPEEPPKDGLHIAGALGSKRVYVALPRDGHFGRSVRTLALSATAPCILLVPTSACITRETSTIAAAHNIEIRYLDAAVDLDDRGRLIARSELQANALAVKTAKDFRFRLEGDVWDIAYEGDSTKRRDAVGLRHVHRLLANPHTAVSALDLVGAGPEASPQSSQPLADREMLRELHHRLREIDGEIAEAERTGDRDESSRLKQSRLDLLAHVTPLVGKRGVAREFAEAGKRASRSVGMAIDRTIESIGKDLPMLARHFESAICKGTTVVYRPDSIPPWEL